jgi:rubrerythrin
MFMKNPLQEEPHFSVKKTDITQAKLPRRSFLQYSGAGVAGLALIAAGCKKNTNFPTDGTGGDGDGTTGEVATAIELGSGDTGILNYAYVLEQLEAAFYAKVVATSYAGAVEHELEFFKDIAAHEVAHREVLKAALGTSAVANIVVDFSSIDFTNRTKVLEMARTFEDVGVAAYNGAAPLLTTAANLALAAKVVSVEARHSAYIRELLAVNSFADSTAVETTNAFQVTLTPTQVLAAVKPYIKNPITAASLPTA